MQLLTVSACFYRIHHDVLGCHERKLAAQSSSRSPSDIPPDHLRRSGTDPEYRQWPGIPLRMERRLLAESSSVLSNHWVAEVIAGFRASIITYLEREAIRSLLIGFLLYAIAEEPIWDFSKGSSTSFKCCSRRISLDILWALGCDTCQNVHHSGIHLSGIGLSGYRIRIFQSPSSLRSSDQSASIFS